ncbi:MAG TPA: DUF1080 domain-containing protein [Tepidisphaeraceae bacterium]|nr:DUF1080 domain-containing protein [Tepidisphaeraceae bacterium]
MPPRIQRHLPLLALSIAVALLATIWRAGAAGAQQAADATELFNGKDLQGWDGEGAYWSVQDGAITGRTTPDKPLKKNTFLIWKGGTLRDFELRVSYKLSGGNSGVQYRSKDDGDYRVSGYQADIVGGTPDKYSGILYEENGRGILAQRGQKVTIDESGKKEVAGSVGQTDDIVKAIKKGDWNEYVITARGNHLVQQINGVTTVDVIDADKSKAAREGILALQIHVGDPMTVQFKDIRLKVLPPAEPTPTAK